MSGPAVTYCPGCPMRALGRLCPPCETLVDGWDELVSAVDTALGLTYVSERRDDERDRDEERYVGNLCPLCDYSPCVGGAGKGSCAPSDAYTDERFRVRSADGTDLGPSDAWREL